MFVKISIFHIWRTNESIFQVAIVEFLSMKPNNENKIQKRNRRGCQPSSLFFFYRIKKCQTNKQMKYWTFACLTFCHANLHRLKMAIYLKIIHFRNRIKNQTKCNHVCTYHQKKENQIKKKIHKFNSTHTTLHCR